jgi:hypothetical protein
MKAKQPALEAVRLLGRWQRLAGGHIMFGAGCSCGAATASVRVQDFEQDILGFLRGRHRRAAGAAAIAELLAGITRRSEPADLALLADLERSVDSFESLHRGGGGS